MLAKVCSAALSGIDAYPVEVEVNAGYGDTLIIIVGLPDAAVKESRDRVTTALINSGYSLPMGRMTINLAPADVKKEGPGFDLPIALGTLAASEQIETDQLEAFCRRGRTRVDRRSSASQRHFADCALGKSRRENWHVSPGRKRRGSGSRRRPAGDSRPEPARGRAVSRR